MKKILVIFTYLISFNNLKANTKWNGFTLRMQGGIYADYCKIKEKNGTYSTPKGVDATFGWGMEYSLLIKNHLYLAGDFGFPYHTATFNNGTIQANPLIGNFSFHPIFMFILPIIYLHIGYAWEDWVVTIGSAYLWGTNFTIKKSITSNVSFEFRWTWFVDKLIYNDGFHDMHFLFSLRYTF